MRQVPPPMRVAGYTAGRELHPALKTNQKYFIDVLFVQAKDTMTTYHLQVNWLTTSDLLSFRSAFQTDPCQTT